MELFDELKGTTLRVYGDNIIECLRVMDLLSQNSHRHFMFDVDFRDLQTVVAIDEDELVELDLLPGFGKSDKKRWKQNIIEKFQNSKQLLDETPDAIITKIEGNRERILLAIEFCSALQAGNQAWQRSGRAYSVGKVGIPYLYIVDFTKYELNPTTRERKNLRLPNLAVPLSYNAYSEHTNNLVIETYFKSEEFNPDDPRIKEMDFSNIFSEQEVSDYLFSLCFDEPADEIRESLLKKNEAMIRNLAPAVSSNSITQNQLVNLSSYDNLIKFIEDYCDFHGQKKIEEKSSSSDELQKLNSYLGANSNGIFSSDLPFCLLGEKALPGFLRILSKDYHVNDAFVKKIKENNSLVVVLIKGFKPRGDDNRPDRGILPLVRMTFGEETPVMTVVYGPIISSSYALFTSDPDALAQKNGLWKTIIYLSDYLLIDSPIITKVGQQVKYVKEARLTNRNWRESIDFPLTFPKLDVSPLSLREDDVDDLILTAFKYHSTNTFSGLCNPPGGDWSGMSVMKNGNEYRWLSLPRVSEDNYKRPDHIIQFINNNILLIIESKDYGTNLECGIGPRLSGYVRWLMQFVPSVKKADKEWKIATNKISARDYIFLTAGAFIGTSTGEQKVTLKQADTDLIFSFVPSGDEWSVDITYRSNEITDKIILEIKSSFEKLKIVTVVDCYPI